MISEKFLETLAVIIGRDRITVWVQAYIVLWQQRFGVVLPFLLLQQHRLYLLRHRERTVTGLAFKDIPSRRRFSAICLLMNAGMLDQNGIVVKVYTSPL